MMMGCKTYSIFFHGVNNVLMKKKTDIWVHNWVTSIPSILDRLILEQVLVGVLIQYANKLISEQVFFI
jgi:hypothetical protein